jgi:sulfotransferase famil protein
VRGLRDLQKRGDQMICHQYRCIFIHIPKNAGQSIEHVFLKLLDLDWDTRAPLLLRYNDRPELGPPRLAHLKACEYVRYKYVTKQQFDDYFKFSFVRNPWDRTVSIYTYFGWQRYIDFKTFVVKKLPNEVWRDNHWFVGPQSDFICDVNGHVAVDLLGKFENLTADFNAVCQRLGLPPTELPHVNTSKKQPAKVRLNRNLFSDARWLYHTRTIPSFKTIRQFTDYRDYYDDESKEVVAELYQKDIELFGYQFD